MNKKNILILSIIAVFLLVIDITYAYFTAEITGRETTSTIIVNGGQMHIHYDNNSGEIIAQNIYPREEAWVTKNFTVTGTNTTDLKMKYKVGLDITTNTFPDDYLTYSLTNTRKDSGTSISNKTNKPINGTGTIWFGEGLFVTGTNQVHAYTLNIYFPDTGEDQNDAQTSALIAKVIIEENGTGELGKSITIDLGTTTTYGPNYDGCVQFFTDEYYNGESIPEENQEPVDTICTTGEYNGFDLEDMLINDHGMTLEEAVAEGILEVTSQEPITEIPEGYEYTDGPYIYRYKQSFSSTGHNGKLWSNQNTNGWGVALTDSVNGTNLHANDDLVHYSYINGEPVLYMDYMFTECDYIDNVDFSSFNTTNVISMEGMFSWSSGMNIDLSAFDTSNVVNVQSMFYGSSINKLILTSFNLDKVTSLNSMFSGYYGDYLDLSSFDTSRITDMSYMFFGVNIPSLDISNFDTSNVTNMNSMFSSSRLETLNISHFVFNSIGLNDFLSNSQSLRSLILDNADFSKIYDGKYLFSTTRGNTNNTIYNCNNLKSISLKGSNFSGISDDADTDMMFKSNTLESVDLTNTIFPNARSFNNMFRESSVSSVIFTGATYPYLQSTVNMFNGSTAQSLNIVGLDTSNVSDMTRMFSNSSATTLDLSWMDTSSVTNTDNMFENAVATVGYARTQADSDKLNASSYKPSTLTFVVKP